MPCLWQFCQMLGCQNRSSHILNLLQSQDLQIKFIIIYDTKYTFLYYHWIFRRTSYNSRIVLEYISVGNLKVSWTRFSDIYKSSLTWNLTCSSVNLDPFHTCIAIRATSCLWITEVQILSTH